jgi:dTDP-4-amino-4,6-dideoxygalactose transaminase
MYYLVLPTLGARTSFIDRLKSHSIHAVFHYVPLHSSPFGRKVGRAHGEMQVTAEVGERLVRLPLWIGLERYQGDVIAKIIEAAEEACTDRKATSKYFN